MTEWGRPTDTQARWLGPGPPGIPVQKLEKLSPRPVCLKTDGTALQVTTGAGELVTR